MNIKQTKVNKSVAIAALNIIQKHMISLIQRKHEPYINAFANAATDANSVMDPRLIMHTACITSTFKKLKIFN